MRQAGRCLPEYRALKEKFTFRQLIREPELATEVTLQPIRRFDFDAAILFSDILVVPEALGLPFHFTEKLEMETLKTPADIAKLNAEGVVERLQYVAQALRLIRKDLGERTGLLGFAGSPWTLANFMLEGGGMGDYRKAFELFSRDRRTFELLMSKLTRATVDYLSMQIDCGVDAVQIFDSLGGLVSAEDFEAASGRWIGEIIAGLQERAPVIVFSKGTRAWPALIRTGARVIGVDHEIDLALVMRCLTPNVGVQGNFNPQLLSQSEPRAVEKEARALVEKMRGRNGYIFNLGHGVPPDARMENLEALVNSVRSFS